MKISERSAASIKMGVAVFFLIGLFDISRLFFHSGRSYPTLEKLIGAAYFLSIYVFAGAFFGRISNFLQSIFLGSKKPDAHSPKSVLVDLAFYPAVIIFLVLMFYVHTELIAKSFLSFVSIVTTIVILLLSAAVFFALSRMAVCASGKPASLFLRIPIILRTTALPLLIIAGVALISTAIYFCSFPFYPFFKSPALKPGGMGSDGLNVVLVTVDTLRADFVGCYGNKKIATPNIDKLARGGVTFSNAVAQASLTTPSHASILTGTYVHTHGSGDNCEFLSDSVPTLAETLRDSGYSTAAFVSGFPLKSDCSGIDKGFDFFNDQFSRLEFCRDLFIVRLSDKIHLSRIDRLEQNAGDVNAKALCWLKRNTRNKFFLWVHYYDPHTPYKPPKRFKAMYSSSYRGKADGYPYGLPFWKAARPEDIAEMVSLYQGEISYTDDQIGGLVSELERLGLAKNTIFVFTSDHGEGLAEHSKYFVHQTLYDHDIKVPLILRAENVFPPGRRIEAQVQTIDIMPTILDMLDIPVPERVEGRSLLDLALRDGTDWTEEAYSERRKYVSLRTPVWKLIVSTDGTRELYNLEQNGAETQDLSLVQNPIAAELLRKIGEYENKAIRNESKNKKELTEETKERLRSLGYIR